MGSGSCPEKGWNFCEAHGHHFHYAPCAIFKATQWFLWENVLVLPNFWPNMCWLHWVLLINHNPQKWKRPGLQIIHGLQWYHLQAGIQRHFSTHRLRLFTHAFACIGSRMRHIEYCNYPNSCMIPIFTPYAESTVEDSSDEDVGVRSGELLCFTKFYAICFWKVHAVMDTIEEGIHRLTRCHRSWIKRRGGRSEGGYITKWIF